MNSLSTVRTIALGLDVSLQKKAKDQTLSRWDVLRDFLVNAPELVSILIAYQEDEVFQSQLIAIPLSRMLETIENAKRPFGDPGASGSGVRDPGAGGSVVNEPGVGGSGVVDPALAAQSEITVAPGSTTTPTPSVVPPGGRTRATQPQGVFAASPTVLAATPAVAPQANMPEASPDSVPETPGSAAGLGHGSSAPASEQSPGY